MFYLPNLCFLPNPLISSKKNNITRIITAKPRTASVVGTIII